MKKICILCEYLSYVGGGERVYCSWANMLAEELNHQVIIASLENWEKPFYKLSPKITVHSLQLRKAKFYESPRLRRLSMITNYISDVKYIKKYLNEEKFDVVIGIAVNINLILSRITGNFIKVATEHSEYHAPNRAIQFIRNILYKNFDILTVLNKYDQTLFKKHNRNTIVLPNPVETLNDRSAPAKLSNSLLISIGSLSPQKNQSDLIDIMNIIHTKYPDWKLKIYGRGPLKKELQDKIQITNSSAYISLEGITHDVNQVLSEASIFLLTSKIEGFGLVLIEAMGRGLPCVSYRAYGPDSIINDCVTGFLIEQGEKETFATKVCQLISDYELRLKMGTNAYNSVEAYKPSEIAKLWQKILNSSIVKND